MAALVDQLTFWQEIRHQQIEEGSTDEHAADTITKGDKVKIRSRWYEVVRANKKSVTVRMESGASRSAPYREVQEHLPYSTKGELEPSIPGDRT